MQSQEDAKVSEDVQTPQQDKPQSPSNEQLNQIKVSLINSVQKTYTEFLTTISSMPCNLDVKKIALQFFDTGYLWFKEGIVSFDFAGMQIIIPDAAQQQEVVPDAPTVA